MNNSDIWDAAERCGEWILRNQVKERIDANRGRGIRFYDHKTKEMTLTGNWATGIQCMALLALHKRTGDEKYLEAAERAGRYIMSMQILDGRDQRYFGAIREVTPQSAEILPRDSTTAAWALLWLHNATNNPIYLDRANLFGKWHMRFAMYNQWPVWALFTENPEGAMTWHGSFQSGTGLFYYDLFMATRDLEFIDKGLLPIARKYRDEFFDKDGGIIMAKDSFTEQPTGDFGIMHMLNDDFGASMLQQAADFFGDESYREQAYKYAKWLVAAQEDDGGFGSENPSGVPVSMMHFHDLGEYYNDEVLLNARDKAISKILSSQFDLGDSKIDGAFKGAYEGNKQNEGGGELCHNNRTTIYSLMALLKVESDLESVWLSRFNKKFEDPNKTGEQVALVW